MCALRFDAYYRYDELIRGLQDCAARYPHLVRLQSIGRSFEGREIWLAAVTRFDTGPDDEKPAFWVDGNIHAAEVAASSACLYLIHRLVEDYGADSEVTRCLDTRAFYVCPRVNPDGAEWALAERPRLIRSGTRAYPYLEQKPSGLTPEDIDGDGRILWMRMPDPNGAWRPSAEDPRLLVRREPAEVGGEYYRLLPEGLVENFDGVAIDLKPKLQGLDFNRNFPASWRQEQAQKGAGPYPTSEPEVRAVVDFVAGHPNVTGGVSFHTYSGALLRPYSDRDDDAFPAEDLWTYRKIGQTGSDLTGYRAVSSFHEFRYHPKEVTTGVFDDWLYDHQGVFGWTVELWSPQREAGIEGHRFIEWDREHPVEDDLKLLAWSDRHLGGGGYVDWYAFQHPQLGSVELGGWDYFHVIQNPPPEFLQKEIQAFPKWLVWHLLISPRLELREAGRAALGGDLYRVRLVVENTGWLPTYVTKHALEKNLVQGVRCEIELPEGASLPAGEALQQLGQIEGRAYKPSAPGGWLASAFDPTVDRLKAEWVVKAPRGGTVWLHARHERAGIVRAQVEL
jgi:murein tripeptide amidase MpaA